MKPVDTSPPAFPGKLPLSSTNGAEGDFAFFGGMTLRDYFAATASEEDIQSCLPKSVGETASLMLSLRWIDQETHDLRVRQGGILPDPRLRQWARYQHANAMLAVREQGGAA